eukprot:jgi/Bigna1/83442/fgenesh1_pg.108_\
MSRRYVRVKSVNDKPQIPAEERKKLNIKNLHIYDSGCGGRIYKHILQGSLWLVLTEMTLYIFLVNILFGCFSTLMLKFLLLRMLNLLCCGMVDDFNFSFQTFTTVGYGTLSPQGPAINTVVFFQGVVFTKFIRPKWKFKFSDVMVRNVRSVPTLEFRFGNVEGAYNDLLNVTATAYLGRFETDPDGQRFHPTHTLELVTECKHSVRGVWTLQIHVAVTGIDPITEESVCKIMLYEAKDVLFGYQFKDQVKFIPENFTLTFNYANLSEVEPAWTYYPATAAKRHPAIAVDSDKNNGQSSNVGARMETEKSPLKTSDMTRRRQPKYGTLIAVEK